MTYLELWPRPRLGMLAKAAGLLHPIAATQIVGHVVGNPRWGAEIAPGLMIADLPGMPLGMAYGYRQEHGHEVVTPGGIFTLGDEQERAAAVEAARDPGGLLRNLPPPVVYTDGFVGRLPRSVRAGLLADLQMFASDGDLAAAEGKRPRRTHAAARISVVRDDDDHLALITSNVGTGAILVTEFERVLIVVADAENPAALERGQPRRVMAATQTRAVRYDLSELAELFEAYSLG